MWSITQSLLHEVVRLGVQNARSLGEDATENLYTRGGVKLRAME